MTTFDDKLVAVTGGALGIGKGIVAALVGAGSTVAVMDFDGAALETLDAELAGDGRGHVTFRGDTTSPEEVASFFDKVRNTGAPLHGLVNNVGGGGPTAYTPFEKLEPEQWESVVSINLLSPFLCSRAAVPLLREAGDGRIVNIASIAASLAIPGLAAYSAAKAGVLAFTRSMAIELAPEGILVNAVSPGHVLTETAKRLVPEELQAKREAVIPMGRYGEPDDVAAAVLFALGQAKWFTGNVLNVDGGMASAMIRPIA